MQANANGYLPVEEETRDRLADVPPQFVPCVGLREDIFGQALHAVTAVGFLHNLKHQLDHTSIYYANTVDPSHNDV